MAGGARGAVAKARAVASATMDADSRQRLVEIVSILNKHQLLRHPSPESAKAVLEDLGPTFIKLGQMVSSHSDVFPAEYCETFASLRNETTPLPFEEIERILGETFGEGYGDFLHGNVVDMFYFPLFSFDWPAWMPFVGGENFVFFSPIFNFADACISCGIVVLLLFYRGYIEKPFK
jgi:hypothetical protein